MKILPITKQYIDKKNNNFGISCNNSLVYPTMTSTNEKVLKSNLFEKIFNYIKSKNSNSQKNIINNNFFIKFKRPILVKNKKGAIHSFVKNENFNEKVLVKNSDGSFELFFRKFDPVSHETRIYSDLYDFSKTLNNTTVYDKNGLKLSQYFVKINNPNEPISIRRKDFNVSGKIIHEEIKYKNGDLTNIDYDYLRDTQTFETLKSNGAKEIVINSKYSFERRVYDKDGNILVNNIMNF